MPRKKAAAKTTKAAKTARVRKTTRAVTPRKQSAFGNFVEYLKLGESYTSLVLGIIAVIIGTVLLLSVVHNRQGGRITPEVTPTIAQSKDFVISPTGEFRQPTMAQELAPAEKSNPISPVKPQEQAQKTSGKVYVVQAGDNLWTIAEKVYGSGYNWVDIARANNLSDPDDIHVGNTLVTPQVKLQDATVQTNDEHLSRSQQTSIKTETYTVVPGDNLWGIAVRAYGDGYQWVKIAKANNLTDPNLIHVDNTLKIPRQ